MLRNLLLTLLFFAAVEPAGAQQLKDADFIPPKSEAPFTDSAIFGKPKPAPRSAKVEPPPPEAAILGIPPLPPPPKIWSGGLELGLNGSSGNSDVLKIRIGFDVKRDTPTNLFTASGWYGMANQNGVVSENKAIFNARDELPFPNSPWGLFASTLVEYDQFRAYDLRAGLYGGLIYEWLKTPKVNLRSRLGAGAQREFGSDVRDQWVPEGLVGFDASWQITERSRLVSWMDAYPGFENWKYRIRARAAYEVLVDPDLNLFLRVGVQDRYDSDPGPAKRNDVDYFAAILFQF